MGRDNGKLDADPASGKCSLIFRSPALRLNELRQQHGVYGPLVPWVAARTFPVETPGTCLAAFAPDVCKTAPASEGGSLYRPREFTGWTLDAVVTNIPLRGGDQVASAHPASTVCAAFK